MIRLLCVGDSITQGSQGGNGVVRLESYRYPLWKMFVDAGQDVEFVGSMEGGFQGDPEWPDYKRRRFPRRHEGHWGWPSAQLREALPDWTRDYAWDVALILAGTNDPPKKIRPEQSKRELGKMIDLLRERRPSARVLLGQCCAPWIPYPTLRARVAELARERDVRLVDHRRGWNSRPGRHTQDWIHPNEAGDLRLADGWFQAIKQPGADMAQRL
jgi:lysophospholipase L1-like esterase